MEYYYEKKGDFKNANKCIKKAEDVSLSHNLTCENICGALDKNEWKSIKDLILKLKIKKMTHTRILQIKLKRFSEENQILMEIRKERKYWRLI